MGRGGGGSGGGVGCVCVCVLCEGVRGGGVGVMGGR